MDKLSPRTNASGNRRSIDVACATSAVAAAPVADVSSVTGTAPVADVSSVTGTAAVAADDLGVFGHVDVAVDSAVR